MNSSVRHHAHSPGTHSTMRFFLVLFERGIPSLRDAVVDLFRRGQTSLDEVIPLLNY